MTARPRPYLSLEGRGSSRAVNVTAADCPRTCIGGVYGGAMSQYGDLLSENFKNLTLKSGHLAGLPVCASFI